ncbi:hypothetical protein [Micromonospora sp. DPT]|uniref:hypothetical protein n=1 Tax=Micromonospora sp. DPT TaxID=3142975 RepID=UPI00320ADC05
MSRMKMLLVGRSRSRFGSSRRFRAGLLALAATIVTVFAAPTPSMADGDQYFVSCEASWASCQTGVKVSYPTGMCDTVSAWAGATIVCIDYGGDHVYVKDNDADGSSAIAKIESEFGVSSRFCRNPYGAGSWAACNFNWSEAGQKDVYAGILQNSATMPLQYLWSFSNN